MLISCIRGGLALNDSFALWYRATFYM